MCLSIVSPSCREEEGKVQSEIQKSLDNNESIIFSAGAGAGKTYALIESLKYIINRYGNNLKIHNQSVICITYTNVATEEVKERLGNSDLVKVSTIHERIWDLIKKHQNELVLIHKKKLEEEIKQLNTDIESNNKYLRYRELKEQREDFCKIMLSKNDLFYKNYSLSAKKFKEVFENDLNDFPNILCNVSNFKKIVSTIYKINNYETCLTRINSSDKNYSLVIYDSRYNTDRLHFMRISHDTLLEYGFKIIDKYNLLKRIIIDKYPFVLIDEYQDTNEKVVQIMNALSKYADKIRRSFFIGYFGDTAQNIYDDGVGNRINEIHTHLKKINKKYNRRSTQEVINIINNIRHDAIKQISIYDDCIGGSVKFYTGGREKIKKFLSEYITKWNINCENKLHCLLLTNKTVAEFSGFENIYSCFSHTEKYRGINYQQLNTELLSDDLSKLGEIPLQLYRIISFRNHLKQPNTPILRILFKEIYEDMDLSQLRDFIKPLRGIDGDTLNDYVSSISDLYKKSNKTKVRILFDKLIGISKISTERFKNNLIEKLYPNLIDDDIENANANILSLMEINLNEYELWFDFIINEQKEEIVYHTYHGTKGLEFDNVVIVMENAFGRSSNYFNLFFKQIAEDKRLNSEQMTKFSQIQNLLYVSCSRAIKNLRILYLDDITEFNEGVSKVFGSVYSY